jgi:hypothetical protein
MACGVSTQYDCYNIQVCAFTCVRVCTAGLMVVWVTTKGVGPSTTLAWPGWKQPDIAVEEDTARLETSRLKKCGVNCVLLYYPSTEFKSAFNVY